MSYPVISNEQVLALNRKATDISPELFWCCNYTPTPSYAISEDAIFLSSIQNLYKFTVDTGGLIKKFWSICEQCPTVNEKNTNTVIDTVELLRSIVDHNNSQYNGIFDEQRLKQYEQWVKRLINKDTPCSPEDFKALNAELERLGCELLSISNKMIEYAISQCDKEDIKNSIIEQWRSKIIDWYCSHFDIYLGVLINTFLSRAILQNPTISHLPTYDLRKRTIKWIGQIPVALREELSSIQDMIQMVNNGKYNVKAEQQKKIEQFIIQQKKRCTKIQEILNEYSTEKPLNVFKKHLSEQLKITLSALISYGEPFSMLPQDLIQADIERVFKAVPSPGMEF